MEGAVAGGKQYPECVDTGGVSERERDGQRGRLGGGGSGRGGGEAGEGWLGVGHGSKPQRKLACRRQPPKGSDSCALVRDT